MLDDELLWSCSMAKRGLNMALILFAAKYMPYMPTEEELRQEIEQQKQFFLEQHK